MSLVDVLSQLEQADEEMSKLAAEEEAAGRIMARGFVDELNKLAEDTASWIMSAMPKKTAPKPAPAAPAAPKPKPMPKPKANLGSSGDTMKMKTIAPGSAQAKAINRKAKTMPKPKSMAQTEREEANARYERNKRLQQQDEWR